jgi:hypothetical protein
MPSKTLGIDPVIRVKGRKLLSQMKSIQNCIARELTAEGSSYLVWGDTLLLWSPAGYEKKRERPNDLTVTILTPEPVVRCIRQGYRPEVHKSSLALSKR